MSTANSGAASKKPLSNMDSSSPPFIKQLSQAKMAARRAKGLCYNYDESCSFVPYNMFYLGFCVDISVSCPCISLHLLGNVLFTLDILERPGSVSSSMELKGFASGRRKIHALL